MDVMDPIAPMHFPKLLLRKARSRSASSKCRRQLHLGQGMASSSRFRSSALPSHLGRARRARGRLSIGLENSHALGQMGVERLHIFHRRCPARRTASHERTPLGFISCWRIVRSEEHTSELQSLMRISYAVFCLKKKKQE